MMFKQGLQLESWIIESFLSKLHLAIGHNERNGWDYRTIWSIVLRIGSVVVIVELLHSRSYLTRSIHNFMITDFIIWFQLKPSSCVSFRLFSSWIIQGFPLVFPRRCSSLPYFHCSFQSKLTVLGFLSVPSLLCPFSFSLASPVLLILPIKACRSRDFFRFFLVGFSSFENLCMLSFAFRYLILDASSSYPWLLSNFWVDSFFCS